jgi:hypothetical protein
MSIDAQTPEELETLFEDTLMLRDHQALAELFEDGAVLVIGNERSARGGEAIARLALVTWAGGQTYVANPQYVMQARDIALIVCERGINVVRRSRCGTWRYAIVRQSVEDNIDFGPRDIPHRYTVGRAGCRMLFITTPGGFEDLVIAMSEPAGSRTLPPPSEKEPNWEQVAAIAKANGCALLG